MRSSLKDDRLEAIIGPYALNPDGAAAAAILGSSPSATVLAVYVALTASGNWNLVDTATSNHRLGLGTTGSGAVFRYTSAGGGVMQSGTIVGTVQSVVALGWDGVGHYFTQINAVNRVTYSGYATPFTGWAVGASGNQGTWLPQRFVVPGYLPEATVRAANRWLARRYGVPV